MKFLFLASFALPLTFASFAMGSFEQNTRRYLSGPELLWSLYRVLPRSSQSNNGFFSASNSCKMLHETNSSALGIAEPILGEALSPHPHMGTIQWLQDCVNVYFKDNPELTVPWKMLKAFYGYEFINALQNHPSFSQDFVNEEQWSTMGSNLVVHLRSFSWKQLSIQEKVALINGLIFSILGPDEIISDFGFTTKQRLANAYINRLDKTPEKTTFEVIKIISLNLILREEFLSY